ncbi:HD-GYP domain-containing protein [Deinococcus sp. QL22]|uniref:HD-GYP domain-containing protein n=1 Tax=Deinococcus sp. QL22 TaxID=2939437 RepID=UPI002017D988|nr:HD domain-containing phosphohydrolase [Deinococcus sp. QL22]UQN06849.1 HD domain-containing protein [Deinococcus sp. QL22]
MPRDVLPQEPALAHATHLIDLAGELSERHPESSFQLAQLAYVEARRTSDEAAQWAALAQQIPLAVLLSKNRWLAEQAAEIVRLGQVFAPLQALRRIHGILGIAFLRLGLLTQSAEQHRQACVLAQQLGAAELAYALYNSSIRFNEFHRPKRGLELGQEILALDLSGLPLDVQQKVRAYGHLSCAASSAHLAEYALLRGQAAEVRQFAQQGLEALTRLLDLPNITDNKAFQQRSFHVHLRLLELAEPVLEADQLESAQVEQGRKERDPSRESLLSRARADWRAWTEAQQLNSNPSTEQRWLCALGRGAGLRGESTGVHQYFGQALMLAETIPFDDTLWMRLHSQYSRAAQQVGDVQTALIQLELFTRLLCARLQHGAGKALEEMTARFQVAQAQQTSKSARLEAETLTRLVQQREEALQGEQLHTLERLATVAEYRDQDSRAHIQWVGDAAACVAQELGEPPGFVQALQVAARLHDIGKIALPDALLLKPGRLTPAEFKLVQTHTFIGAEILEGPQHPFLPLAAAAARTHHERWDGGGYPAGQRAEAIPLAGRIVSVVDVYDALRAVRPYKQAWTEDAALKYLKDGSGTQFDPQIVDAFLAAHAAGRLPPRQSAGSPVQPSISVQHSA